MNALLLQRVLQRQGVDHGGQHAHVVRGDPIHLARLLGHTAEEIPASDYDRNLHAERMDVCEFSGNFVNAERIDAEALVRRQGLAGEFKQNALEHRSRHG